MKRRVRALLDATPFEPFIIRIADGKEYRVDHPDFVLAVSNEQTQVVIPAGDAPPPALARD